jgi:hypothetical protein
MTDDKVLEFPKSAAERQALAKARQDRERRRLVNAFIDESGQGLFNTPDGVAYADLIIEGCRQTWAVRSKQFRFAYCKYLQREIDRLTDAGSVAALMLKASLNRRRINETIEDFEMRALTSETEREVHLRVASHSGDLYVDLCDRDWHVIRITGAGWQVRYDSGVALVCFRCLSPSAALRSARCGPSSTSPTSISLWLSPLSLPLCAIAVPIRSWCSMVSRARQKVRPRVSCAV